MQLETKRSFACRLNCNDRYWTANRQGPGARFSKVPRTLRAIRKSTTCLFCKAGLFRRCKGNKNNCKVSCLEKPSFWRYKENHAIWNAPVKFRDFRETKPELCEQLLSKCQIPNKPKSSLLLSPPSCNICLIKKKVKCKTALHRNISKSLKC